MSSQCELAHQRNRFRNCNRLRPTQKATSGETWLRAEGTRLEPATGPAEQVVSLRHKYLLTELCSGANPRRLHIQWQFYVPANKARRDLYQLAARGIIEHVRHGGEGTLWHSPIGHSTSDERNSPVSMTAESHQPGKITFEHQGNRCFQGIFAV